jgi:hypothetical protein
VTSPSSNWVIRRLRLIDPLGHGGGGVLRRQYLWMILQCQRFGFRQTQLKGEAGWANKQPAVPNMSKIVTERYRIVFLPQSLGLRNRRGPLPAVHQK